jgi:small subunit ribosomal protein S17
MMRNQRKSRIGEVVSNKADKTIVVALNLLVKHPVYGKFMKKTTKLMAHDKNNICEIGDRVKIIESKPYSKRKRWSLVKIIEKSNKI